VYNAGRGITLPNFKIDLSKHLNGIRARLKRHNRSF
jgi:hypothetical protein